MFAAARPREMELPTRPRTTKPSGRQPNHALSTAFGRHVAQAGRYCATTTMTTTTTMMMMDEMKGTG
ncbi:MAG: hypothetical protein OXH04_07225 [Acidobacteria bacterium]|nr:hypothetical protein [Acidobacteriota bacterium]